MNRAGAACFRNGLQQIIDEAQTASDRAQKICMVDHRNQIRVGANDIARTHEKLFVHRNTFGQSYGRAQSASFR